MDGISVFLKWKKFQRGCRIDCCDVSYGALFVAFIWCFFFFFFLRWKTCDCSVSTVNWHLTLVKAHMRSTSFQKFSRRCLWNASYVRLIDSGPVSSFLKQAVNRYLSCVSLLRAIDGICLCETEKKDFKIQDQLNFFCTYRMSVPLPFSSSAQVLF